MRIQYKKHEKSKGRDKKAYEFKIVDSILKTHFKKLMSISWSYDSKTKAGYIPEDYADTFLELVAKIEKANGKACKKSHEKSIENAKNRSRNGYCDHGDLGSLGYTHGDIVTCPNCGRTAEIW